MPLTSPPPFSFVIYQSSKNARTLTGYGIASLADLPRLSRFTLGAKIDTLFTDTIELILLAGYASKPQKLVLVQRASTKLDALKFFLQIAWEVKALDNKRYLRLE